MEKFHENGVVWIKNIDEEGVPLLVNGYRIIGYKNPMSRVEFINSINREVYVMGDSIFSSSSPS